MDNVSFEERKEIEKAIELKALGYMISYLSDWLTAFKVVDATKCKTELEHAYQRGRYDALSMALEAAMRTQTEILMEGVRKR